jgi:hypothetical protein
MSKPETAPSRPETISLVTCEQAMSMLQGKLQARFATVRRAFMLLDSDKDGVIGMKEFRRSLEVRRPPVLMARTVQGAR